MTQLFNNSLALCAALFLTLTTVGTIVTVPPAQAMSPIAMTQLA